MSRIGRALRRVPRAGTIDGQGSPPPIAWKGVPANARSIVVVCEDPDAPMPQPFVHWLGTSKYTPAAPPRGDDAHHYHFQVFALDVELSLEPGAGRSALLEAMRGHVVVWGELVGTYRRA